MSQTCELLQILHRTEKSAVSMIERRFAGVTMEAPVRAVYEQKRAAVAAIEAKLKGVWK